MRVRFKTTLLKRYYESVAKGTRRWGETVARRNVGRDHLYKILPLRVHPVKEKDEVTFSMVLPTDTG